MTTLNLNDLRTNYQRATEAAASAEAAVLKSSVAHTDALAKVATGADPATVQKTAEALDSARRNSDLQRSIVEAVATAIKQAEEAEREATRNTKRQDIRKMTTELRSLAIAAESQLNGLKACLQRASEVELAGRKLAGEVTPGVYFAHVGSDFARSLLKLEDLSDASKFLQDRFLRATSQLENA